MNSIHKTPLGLGGTVTGARTLAFMHDLSRDGVLSQRTRLRIAIYLARRGQGIFRLDSLRECGRAAGMNGAEMNANERGTSHEAMDTACLLFVQALLDQPQAPSPTDLQRMREVGYTIDEMLEVIAQVSTSQLLARLGQVIASPPQTMACSAATPRLSAPAT